MDKYEEFKKWFVNQDKYRFRNVENGEYANTIVFKKFEEEQAEKEKEEEIKMIISRIMYCESYYYLSIKQQGKVSKIYDELEEKDLIK